MPSNDTEHKDIFIRNVPSGDVRLPLYDLIANRTAHLGSIQRLKVLSAPDNDRLATTVAFLRMADVEKNEDAFKLLNYSVFTFNGLKRINVNDRRLADQTLALAQGELSLAKTEKKLLESELLLPQRRTAQLTAAMEGDIKVASLTIAKPQQGALEIKSDHIEEARQLKEAHEHSTADRDNQITMLGRELNVLETHFRCGVCYDTYGDDMVCIEMCGHVFCRRCTDREARYDEDGNMRVRCFYCTGSSNSLYFKIFL